MATTVATQQELAERVKALPQTTAIEFTELRWITVQERPRRYPI